ncbi:uncharacterized protein AMSG_02104 [Thecamonas trahens ATCC 50062]|uniref:Armadillo-like helical domain-containing protein n=1 Tax=Thecamonas trahens ATCC 50062 TaxID=461836 RepID=A0A0L0DVJ9_THETB|nr:hypothetical protein AMSG_02104 [Thecamonas trahens ATCC 50062]KNC56091.1 hypothetical protein AMSG_02104 [Thecamonas trahens ATCC 50062]|eukprot:XP_013761133.1 hypothetical protein AMSG_02104 [Thecamonas trahens ATCC 50062]
MASGRRGASKYRALLLGLTKGEAGAPPPPPDSPPWPTLLMLKVDVDVLAAAVAKPDFPLHALVAAAVFHAAAAIEAPAEKPVATRAANALATLSAVVNAVITAEAEARGSRNVFIGYELLSRLAPFEAVDSLFVGLLQDVARLLAAASPRPPTKVLAAAVELALTLATASPLLDQNTLLEYFQLEDVLGPLLVALADPVLRVKAGAPVATLLTLLLSHMRDERESALRTQLATLDRESSLTPLLDLVRARVKIALSKLGKALVDAPATLPPTAGPPRPSLTSRISAVGASVLSLARLSKPHARPRLHAGGSTRVLSAAEAESLPSLAALLAAASTPRLLLPPAFLLVALLTANRNVGVLLEEELAASVAAAAAAVSSIAASDGSAGPSAPPPPARGWKAWLPTWKAGAMRSAPVAPQTRVGLGFDRLDMAAAFVVYARKVLQLPQANDGIVACQSMVLVGVQVLLESRQLGRILVDKSHGLVLGDARARAPLAIHILGATLESAAQHLAFARQLPVMHWPLDLVGRCLGCVHRVLYLMRRAKARLDVAWPGMVTLLLEMLASLAGAAAELSVAQGGPLGLAVGNAMLILNMIIQHGADFLPSSAVYDEVFLLLADTAAPTIAALPALLQHTAAGVAGKRVAGAIRGLDSSLVFNLTEIVDHFREPLAARRTKSAEQGLAVIQAHFKTLVLVLDIDVASYNRWSEDADRALLLHLPHFLV